MIELKNIRKSFQGVEVINDLNLKVEQGSTQVLLGLSGSGKTTSLKLINGLIQADSGSVSINGKTLNKNRLLEQRRDIGYIIQEGGLFPHYTVFENIALVPRLLKWGEQKIMERCELIMNKLLLDPKSFSNKYPDQLSGGQAQRVGIARALAVNPTILLMDEPFGALDPITRSTIRREFLQLDELKEKTIVIVTHDVQEAFELGDKIALMHEGRIIQNDSPGNILEKPSDFALQFIKDQWLSLSLKERNIYHKINDGLLANKWDLRTLENLINE